MDENWIKDISKKFPELKKNEDLKRVVGKVTKLSKLKNDDLKILSTKATLGLLHEVCYKCLKKYKCYSCKKENSFLVCEVDGLRKLRKDYPELSKLMDVDGNNGYKILKKNQKGKTPQNQDQRETAFLIRSILHVHLQRDLELSIKHGARMSCLECWDHIRFRYGYHMKDNRSFLNKDKDEAVNKTADEKTEQPKKRRKTK